MKLLNITGIMTWIVSGIIIVHDIINGWFLFKSLTIKDILEILLLIGSLVYLIYRIIYERKKIRREQLEIDDFEECRKIVQDKMDYPD